jgi:hypothetical protein
MRARRLSSEAWLMKMRLAEERRPPAGSRGAGIDWAGTDWAGGGWGWAGGWGRGTEHDIGGDRAPADAVAIAQDGPLGQPAAVDLGAVGRGQVAHGQLRAIPVQFGVMPADLGQGQADAGVRGAADVHPAVAQLHHALAAVGEVDDQPG